MPVHCRLCTIFIGEGYYNLDPYYLKIKGEKVPFCQECYKELKVMSGWDRIREIAREDYIRLSGDEEEDTETENSQEIRYPL